MRCKSTAAIAAAIAMGMAISTPGYAQHRHGGHWGHHGGHWRHHHHGGWGAAAGGFAVGALIGSALAAPRYYYYDEPGYYYAPDVYAGPDPSTVAYCKQRFRSYDVSTGTYLGYDGIRHPCP